KSGDVGVKANVNADDLVVENSFGFSGISVLSNDSQRSVIYFGSPSDSVSAAWQFNYSEQLMSFGTAGLNHPNVSIRTGNNVEMLRIAPSGVGIGTSAPDSVLHVNTSSTAAGLNTSIIRIQNPNTAANARTGIGFAVNAHTGSNWDGSMILGVNDGVSTGDLAFGSVLDSVFTEYVRFDSSSKNVGIGTATPNGTLEIFTGDSGFDTRNTNNQVDDLIIEGSVHTGISIFGSEGGSKRIVFGNATNEFVGRVEVVGRSMNLFAGGVNMVSINGSGDYVDISGGCTYGGTCTGVTIVNEDIILGDDGQLVNLVDWVYTDGSAAASCGVICGTHLNGAVTGWSYSCVTAVLDGGGGSTCASTTGARNCACRVSG
ncbi:MAG TPA: hypothetical protein VJI69_08115, partial [Bacteroidia bacterium]|nr:hypothetical protein [Bacteroidia bacterium]